MDYQNKVLSIRTFKYFFINMLRKTLLGASGDKTKALTCFKVSQSKFISVETAQTYI